MRIERIAVLGEVVIPGDLGACILVFGQEVQKVVLCRCDLFLGLMCQVVFWKPENRE